MAHKRNYRLHASAHFPLLDEEWRLGRLSDDNEVSGLLRTLLKRSRRVGWSAGKPARTFHINIRPFKASPKPRPARTDPEAGKRAKPRRQKSTANQDRLVRRRTLAKLAYIHRFDQYADRDDLVLTGGRSIQEMVLAVEALWSCSFRRDAALLCEIVCELPAGIPAGQYRRAAEAMAAQFRQRGCPYTYAVHHPDGNPHVHILVAARPCREVAPGYWVAEAQGRSGSPGFKLFDGGEAVRKYRQHTAIVINAVCAQAVKFHPGRRSETGLEGEPETRGTRSELLDRNRALLDALLDYVRTLREKGLSADRTKQTQTDGPEGPTATLPARADQPGTPSKTGQIVPPRGTPGPSRPEADSEQSFNTRTPPSSAAPTPQRGLSLSPEDIDLHFDRIKMLDFDGDAAGLQQARAVMLKASRGKRLNAKFSAETLLRFFEPQAQTSTDVAEFCTLLRRNLRVLDEVLAMPQARPPDQAPRADMPAQRPKPRLPKARGGYER